MLKKDVSEFDKNVFNELSKTWGIITAGNKETGCNSMTVSWGGFGVLWGMNVCFLFVRKTRYTKEFLDKTNQVTISFLPNKYIKEKTLFGRQSGRNVNKYLETNLHPVYEVDYDGYYLAEADYVFKMKKIHSIDIPKESLPKDIQEEYYDCDTSHTMYICKITHYLVNEE